MNQTSGMYVFRTSLFNLFFVNVDIGLPGMTDSTIVEDSPNILAVLCLVGRLFLLHVGLLPYFAEEDFA